MRLTQDFRIAVARKRVVHCGVDALVRVCEVLFYEHRLQLRHILEIGPRENDPQCHGEAVRAGRRLRVTCARGVGLATARAALAEELERVRSEPPGEHELARVRTQIATSLVRSRQTHTGVALELVRATTERGDPEVANGDLARYLAVTGDDVLRVARTYLRPENRTSVEYLPLTAGAGQAE